MTDADADFKSVELDKPATQILFLRRQDDLTDLVMAELAEWARMTGTVESSRSELGALLSLDGLLTAATSGVIGGAAWSIFPAAARWVKERSAKKPATAAEILSAVKSCLDAIGPNASSETNVKDVIHGYDGSWSVTVTVQSEGLIYELGVDQAGDIVAVVMQPAIRRVHG